MTPEEVAKILAEEIRTNSGLRHRLGMEDGSESGLYDEDVVLIHTGTGSFALTVENA